MHLHYSNRMEALAAALVERMRADPGDPLSPERIVVPHPTIGRWLSFEIARALGIAANLKFELPAGFAWSIIRGALPDLPREQPFSPAQLRWRVHGVLPRFVEEEQGVAGVGAVRSYLRDGDARKRFELADRLARVFDRCIVYRPEWIREWESGDAPHWQARLWRRMVDAEDRASHWVGAIDAFRAALEAGVRPPEWPKRAAFFAVPALSPSYLDLLSGIGRQIDLRLFVLNPCREYWGDIHSRREIGRRAGGVDPGERYLTEGNELLAAWGRGGRDTFDSLVDIAGDGSDDHFATPAGSHRLAAVQRDVLDLRLASEARRVEGGEGRDGAVRRDDSIQIHVCHSPVREVEVLHDRLLGLFETHPDIGPADVLVLTPDLDRYGPATEAVFGAAETIPFHVARSRSAGSGAKQAFFELLAMRRSRLGAEAVLAPLEAEVVRARFGIAASDLPAVRGWVREAGIRWGVDADHRAAEGLPATDEHGWRQGLRRLLLGYALPEPSELVAGVVPCPPRVGGFDFGAEEVALLGRFVSYCEAVFTIRSRLAGERYPREWGRVLRDELLGRFFAGEGLSPGNPSPDPAPAVASAMTDEVGALRDLVRDFEREAAQSASRIGCDVVGDVLRELAGAPSRDAIRLADGVTVTSLGPGQVFPAEVICVLGLNDGTFPRSPSFPSFDLVAAGPARRGDRDVRHEDRFVFLEVLLAARRAFLVTYTGRGPRDDAPIPPAAVVDELGDYLARRFPDASFVTHHPLQPFSPRYFTSPGGAAADGPAAEPNAGGEGGGELFSYSEGMCAAARSLVAGKGESEPSRWLEAMPLEPPAPEGTPCPVPLAELVAFFANPTRWFLRERLGVRLELDDASLDDEEPFALDPLDRYWLRSDLLNHMRAGVTRPRDEALQRGSGRLPQAALGRIEHERVWKEMEGLQRLLERYRDSLDTPPVELDFELGGYRVTGSVENVGPGGVVEWRPASLRARHRVGIWLRQLALAAAGHAPSNAVALSIEDKAATTTWFSAPGEACELFVRWLRAWQTGRFAPLPFFPETSLACAKAVAGGKGKAVALAKADGAWFGSPEPWGAKGELARDPYLRLVYDERPPLTDEFAALAESLLVPMTEAMR